MPPEQAHRRSRQRKAAPFDRVEPAPTGYQYRQKMTMGEDDCVSMTEVAVDPGKEFVGASADVVHAFAVDDRVGPVQLIISLCQKKLFCWP